MLESNTMSLRWSIFGLILACAGGISFVAVTQKNDQQKQKIEACKEKYLLGQDEYCRQYNIWSKLPLKEQINDMWGTGQYGKTDSEQEKLIRQTEKLTADIEGLAGGKKDPPPFADLVYGADWKRQVDDYLAQNKQRQLLRNGSVAAMAAGTIILIISVFWFAISGRRAGRLKNDLKETVQRQNPAAVTWPKELDSEPAEVEQHDQFPIDTPGIEQFDQEPSDQDAIKECWTYESQQPADIQAGAWKQPANSKKTRTEPDPDDLRQGEQVTIIDQKEQLDKIDKNSDGQQKKSQPDGNLGKLTQQVVALRDFAASQQDRVRKLQDGYDWNILKNFCLRIIRCIDNLEFRIQKISDCGEDTTDIEEIHDELVFALESSGVEQFKPQPHDDYSGLEREIEVVKGRSPCSDEALNGKIAAVVRPGYRYVIDDENMKIVRTAQVRLFECSMAELAS